MVREKIASKKLGMTLGQMEAEIEMMRAFDKWLKEVAFGAEQYAVVCSEFAKDITAKEFEKIDPQFAKEIREGVLDGTYSWGHNEVTE